MSSELIINASLPETRIALMENGEIQELLVERASGKGIVGNIYKGRVTRVLPGMQAAFVDIGLEKAAFLYVDDIYVHSDIWENDADGENSGESETVSSGGEAVNVSAAESNESNPNVEETAQSSEEQSAAGVESAPESGQESSSTETEEEQENFDSSPLVAHGDDEEDDNGDDDSGNIVEMSRPPGEDGEGSDDESSDDSSDDGEGDESPEGTVSAEGAGGEEGAAVAGAEGQDGQPRRNQFKKNGNRRRRGRRRRPAGGQRSGTPVAGDQAVQAMPSNFHEQMNDSGDLTSDRANITADGDQSVVMSAEGVAASDAEARPQQALEGAMERRTGVSLSEGRPSGRRPEFNQQRSPDRRIKPKIPSGARIGQRAHVNIQDLLKEGQEVIVQVAKDPIATKGARLTCHISLPGRYLVCMPTIDHVGVSRRIERDDDRRKLRDIVERNRPKNLGFIVRTAIGKSSTEKRIKQDIDYLTRLWSEIREKATNSSAPSLIYEDLNAVLRSIRDWVNEEIDKIIVDSRYHFGEIQRFVAHFMPAIRQKVELYQGDIPIFDAYGISAEISRALDRKVWLKSGGYLVIDQAEALVAIDVNTGRFVGKKNLEDTIFKTNLEAVKEIAYQLRLRNCGGIIILDLIDMEKEENRHRVYRALEEALKKDRARPTIMKISDIGLIEMTRKRTRDTVIRTLCEPCSHCEGKGYIKTRNTVAYEVLREIERVGIDRDSTKILIQGHADVIDFLAIDERESLDQLERKYRKQIYLQAVTDHHPEQFEVSTEKKDRKPGADFRENQQNHRQHSGGGQHRAPRSNPSSVPSESNEASSSSYEPTPPAPKPTPTLSVVISAPSNTVSVVTTAPVVSQSEQPPADPDSFGNRVDYAGSSSVQNVSGGNMATQDDEMDEEDRLAFLRAQAAQDAALAQRNSNGNAAPGNNRSGGGHHRGHHGGGANGGGGRHQKQGHNNNRGKRGGRGGGGRFQDRRNFNNPGGGGGGPRPMQNPGSGVGDVQPAVVMAPSSGGGSSEGGNGGSDPV